MPIRPELRQFYGREWREVIRPRIVRRAKARCEQCGVPDSQPVLRGPVGTWRDGKGIWHTCTAARIAGDIDGPERLVYIVCTVAHLDHNPANSVDSNLKFLCQWCHLNYDKLHHKETRCNRKDAGRPLLQEAV